MFESKRTEELERKEYHERPLIRACEREVEHSEARTSWGSRKRRAMLATTVSTTLALTRSTMFRDENHQQRRGTVTQKLERRLKSSKYIL